MSRSASGRLQPEPPSALTLAFWVRRVSSRGTGLGLSRGRLILRRALGLKGLSDKSAIWGHFAFDQALRSVLKCVGERVRSHVTNGQALPFLHQNQIETAGQVLYRAGLDIPGDSKALVQCRAAQCRDLRDRVVIGLALLGAAVRQAG